MEQYCWKNHKRVQLPLQQFRKQQCGHEIDPISYFPPQFFSNNSNSSIHLLAFCWIGGCDKYMRSATIT